MIQPRHVPVLILAGLGGVIAVLSAIQAIVQVGGDAAYRERLPFGLVALLAGALLIVAGFDARRHPIRGAATLALAGLAGSIAINLFYINTFYVLSLPLALVAAIAAIFSAGVR